MDAVDEDVVLVEALLSEIDVKLKGETVAATNNVLDIRWQDWLRRGEKGALFFGSPLPG